MSRDLERLKEYAERERDRYSRVAVNSDIRRQREIIWGEVVDKIEELEETE